MAIKWKPLWAYIKERESIRLKKLAKQPWPWTKDVILQTFKFTNVKRYWDTTTQWFLLDYRSRRSSDAARALLNCAARRFTGTHEAAVAMGWIIPDDIAGQLRRAEDKSPERFWTGAYMVRGGAKGVRKADAVAEYLTSLAGKAQEITDRIEETMSWAQGYYIMHQCYGFGGNGFMGKEVLQDYILWRHEAGRKPLLDEATWTPVGPGARRGINRVLGRPLLAPMKEEEGLAVILELLEKIQPLWVDTFVAKAQPLTAHDIQFCLCELDKYERTRLGEGRPRSKYRAPKEST